MREDLRQHGSNSFQFSVIDATSPPEKVNGVQPFNRDLIWYALSLGLQGRALSPTVTSKIDVNDGWNHIVSFFLDRSKEPNMRLLIYALKCQDLRPLASCPTHLVSRQV